jgi:aminoglycoside phosphotransferase (APT) family kinase protein
MSDIDPAIIAVLPAHRLDAEKLGVYLKGRIDGLGPAFTIRQFQGGQSNPTYLLESTIGRLVLRKKPPGMLLPSAHQVEREYRVISALYGGMVPVPRPILLCEDAEIIGTPFYVMEYVEGRVVTTLDTPDIGAAERPALFQSMIETMAALHSVDWRAVGLADFGKPDNYLSRQIERWSGQYRASIVDEADPVMEQLIAWLVANKPAVSRTTIAHGDFRMGNLLFDRATPKVVAVLDWELSTLGDPLSDLAYCCLPYHLPASSGGAATGFIGLDLAALGIPSEGALLDIYRRAAGLSEIPHWPFYLAFAFFRLAAISQGVYARALKGNASSANAREVGRKAPLLTRIAWSIASGGEA